MRAAVGVAGLDDVQPGAAAARDHVVFDARSDRRGVRSWIRAFRYLLSTRCGMTNVNLADGRVTAIRTRTHHARITHALEQLLQSAARPRASARLGDDADARWDDRGRGPGSATSSAATASRPG